MSETNLSSDVQESEDVIEQEPTSEWLSFRLAELNYAVDVLRVREIRTWEPSTRVPFSPHCVVGLINLRGAIVPIVDLRQRLHLPSKDYDAETVILIVDVNVQDTVKTIGAVVDAISEVVEISESALTHSPHFDLSIERKFVSGIADDGNGMLILLNLDTLLALDI